MGGLCGINGVEVCRSRRGLLPGVSVGVYERVRRPRAEVETDFGECLMFGQCCRSAGNRGLFSIVGGFINLALINPAL